MRWSKQYSEAEIEQVLPPAADHWRQQSQFATFEADFANTAGCAG